MSGTIEPPTRIPFGPFEADLPSQELKKHGVRLRLPRQSFQILKMLLERRGEVVTREELRADLWPADTFVDFDHGLNAAVKRLRDVLGDTAENPKYIETLPRLGYRFIVAAVPDAVPQGKSHTPLKRWSWLVAAAAVLLSVGALFAVDVGGVRGKLFSRTAAQPQIRSVAVLPLTNLSGDPQQEYFADGMTEELITQLSQISAVRVSSRTSSMRYKRTQKSIEQIAQELGADAIVEGSVLRSGNRVRITAQLIACRSDKHLWAESYERDLGDILKLQSEVSEAIVRSIKLQLTPEEESRLHASREVSSAAYESYLQGRFYITNGTSREIEEAQAYLKKAIALDPRFAPAYAGLADTYLTLGTYRMIPPQQAYHFGKEAITKALELDPSLTEAHGTLGYIKWQYEWDWRGAEQEFLREISLTPNSLNAHINMCWYLAWRKKTDEALREVETIRQLDPAHPLIYVHQSGIYFHARNYSALENAARDAIAANPTGWDGHYFLAVAHEGRGSHREAIPEYQSAVELSNGDLDPLAGLVHAYAASGDRKEAASRYQVVQQHSKSRYISPYMMAVMELSLGNKESALKLLEASYRERSPDIHYFIRSDLRLDPLRSDARFQDLLSRTNPPD